MRNKLIAGMAAVAALLIATPIWADGGHRRGHGDKHHWKNGQGLHPQVRHFQPRAHTVVRERWYPAPVYAAPVYAAPVYAAPVYAAPAPGVHVVLPNIFIPLR